MRYASCDFSGQEIQNRILCSPNEDFGTSKNMWVIAFVSTFHTPKCPIWAESDEKCLQNVLPTYFSTVRNLRLGSINIAHLPAARNRSMCVCDTHIVIFLAKKYKTEYRTSTNRTETRRVPLLAICWTILCSPNEDFGRLNNALRVRF